MVSDGDAVQRAATLGTIGAVSDGSRVLVFKDLGLVSQVFDEQVLSSLSGHIAVGHCRYSTTGSSTWQNAQPTLGGTAGGTVALAHNGNLTNVHELRALVAERHGEQVLGELARGNTTDTALVTALLAGVPAAAFTCASSVVIVWWAFLPPVFEFATPTRAELHAITLFVLSTALLIWFGHLCRTAVRMRKEKTA